MGGICLTNLYFVRHEGLRDFMKNDDVRMKIKTQIG